MFYLNDVPAAWTQMATLELGRLSQIKVLIVIVLLQLTNGASSFQLRSVLLSSTAQVPCVPDGFLLQRNANCVSEMKK